MMNQDSISPPPATVNTETGEVERKLSLEQIDDELNKIAQSIDALEVNWRDFVPEGVTCKSEADLPPEAADAYEQAQKLNSEIVQNAFETYFETLLSNRDDKVDRYCGLIRHSYGQGAAADAEAKRVAKRAKSFVSKADWLKERLKAFMVARGISAFKTALNSVSTFTPGGVKALEIDEDVEIPVEYTKEVLVPDKDAIRNALERGLELPFARLKDKSLTIRIS